MVRGNEWRLPEVRAKFPSIWVIFTGWSSDLLLIVNLEICHAVFDACLTEDGNDPKVVDEGGSLLNAGFAASIQAPSLP